MAALIGNPVSYPPRHMLPIPRFDPAVPHPFGQLADLHAGVARIPRPRARVRVGGLE